MKKIAVILFLLSTSVLLPAQIQDTVMTKKVHPKIFFGMVFASSGSTSFSDDSKPFSLGYNLLPNILITTNKTYHNFMYGMGNNILKIVNGYSIKSGPGIYIAAYKCLNTSDKYIGLGIEKKIKAGNINFFIFSELGTNLKSSPKLLSIGFHV